MPLPTLHPFPYRIPADKLKKAYPSLEAAFAERDYLYVARYAREVDHELHGCALLMLGNRRGGERILDENKIDTARSCLYRASACWQIEDVEGARRWIKKGRTFKDGHAALDRFEELLKRASFKIVFHCDDPRFAEKLENLPGVEVIITNHINDKGERVPIDGNYADTIAGDPSVDLVLIYLVYFFPLGLEKIKAPVVAVTMGDHEWAVDTFDDKIPFIDWQAYVASSDFLQIGKPYGKKGFAFGCWLPPWTKISVKGAARRFRETAGRDIDLVFTGGIAHDIFRDKSYHISPLAHAIEDKFNLFLYDGYLSHEGHIRALRTARFTPVSNRSTNIWSARSADALSQGVINIVEEECGFPYLFSRTYGCFQTYRNEHPIEDITDTLGHYKDILADFLPLADEMEAEASDLFPDGHIGWSRFIRQMLFNIHMDGPCKKELRAPSPHPFRTVTTDRLWLAQHQPDQMQRLTKLSEPAKNAEAADILWHSMVLATRPFSDREDALKQIENALKIFPKSIALHYAHGLMLRNLGRFAAAREAFRKISDDNLELSIHDPFPGSWELMHGFYWIADMQLRERSPDKLQLAYSSRAVWECYALSHQADIVLREAAYVLTTGRPRDDCRRLYKDTLTLTQRGIDKFPYVDTIIRSHLRTLYALFNLGDAKAADDFLTTFEAAIYLDGRIFNDCGPFATDVLIRLGRMEEAEKIKHRRRLFHKRMRMNRPFYYLYPEVQALIAHYDLPHGNAIK